MCCNMLVVFFDIRKEIKIKRSLNFMKNKYIFAIVFLLVICIIAFFFFRDKSNDSNYEAKKTSTANNTTENTSDNKSSNNTDVNSVNSNESNQNSSSEDGNAKPKETQARYIYN